MAKLAYGLADDVLTEAALAHRGPVLVAPAMNPRMWAHPATQANAATLRERGVELIGPDEGETAEGELGVGRMSEPEEIFERVQELLGARNGTLQGKRVLVSAGGTREPLDAVRFVGNRSSGRMGVALADEARRRGAEVTLIASNLAIAAPEGVEVVEAPTAADVERAITARAEADIVLMAAAVSDYRPAETEAAKRPKDQETWQIELEPTVDVLRALGERACERPGARRLRSRDRRGRARARAREADGEARGPDRLQRRIPGRRGLRRQRERGRHPLRAGRAPRGQGSEGRDRRGHPRRSRAARLMQEERATATAQSADLIRRLAENLAKVIHAPGETLRLAVLCLVSEGHMIIEDFPGVGKTMLAKAVARSLDCSFSRLQFTPDLLPSDVTGVNVFNQRSNEFEFRPGPIFANLLLVDEINRAPPKTQAALLECMQENQVTIDGVSYALGRPFMVMATQNPIEYEGTYPLPEAQLDRFTMRLDIGYPSHAEEAKMLAEQTSDPPLDQLEPVTTATGITEVIDEATRVFVEDSLHRYVVALVRKTREDPRLYLGASPRAGIALLRVAKARALADSREYVLPGRRPGSRDRRSRAPAHPRAGSARRRDQGGAARRGSGRTHPGSNLIWPG